MKWVLEQFAAMDCNSESSFGAVKIASFHRGLAEEFGWKFTTWTDASIKRFWDEIASEHDEVRSYIADALELSGKIKVRFSLTLQALIYISLTPYSGGQNLQYPPPPVWCKRHESGLWTLI